LSNVARIHDQLQEGGRYRILTAGQADTVETTGPAEPVETPGG
jgi:hypothetical protein